MSTEQNGGLDLSSLLSKLTENPALISGIVSSLSKPQSEGEAEKSSSAPTSVPTIDPETVSKLLPIVSSLGIQSPGLPTGASQKSSNPRCELLRALRPFLSRERCEAIDYMIKMDGLSGLLQNFKKQ